MTYALFLAIFLGIPLGLLALVWWRGSRKQALPPAWSNFSAGLALALHVLVAVTYTTPWDNYLVATGVWYYNPDLVTGITLGWVPIEEYTFFVLQTLASGLWLLFLARRLPQPEGGKMESPHAPSRNSELWNGGPFRRNATSVLGVIWLATVVLLASRWQPGTYLGLILIWAVPPIMLQLIFGADLLWRKRLPVGLAIVSATLYLGAADTLALTEGTWTIAPDQSLGLLIGGILPVEELIFFLVTNILVVFGITLVMDPTSAKRGQWLKERLGLNDGQKRFYPNREPDQELPGG